jgi:hypothetical protein
VVLGIGEQGIVITILGIGEEFIVKIFIIIKILGIRGKGILISLAFDEVLGNNLNFVQPT